MQSLWSRAGQAHRCGCRACDTAINAVGRRASTAARRRKPTFAEVFTACYSSVFATAAVVDAVRKEDRKQELDHQLSETRRELAELQQLRAMKESSRLTAIPDDDPPELTLDQMDELWNRLKDIHTHRPYMKEIQQPIAHRISKSLNHLKRDYYGSPQNSSSAGTYSKKTDYELLERSIIAEEADPSVGQRFAKTKRQLSNDTKAVAKLVGQLLKRVDSLTNSSQPCPSYDEAQQLLENHSRSYSYPSIDPERVRETSISLNKNLRQIIYSHHLPLKEKVGRVCYNLLISPYTPDIHTVNTLIVAFDRSRLKSLAEPLVNSYFYERRLKPTPSTFVAILHHYKNSGNHGRFLRALACITGLDSHTGAKIRRRHVLDSLANEEFKQVKWRTQTGDWIYDHVTFTQPLIEAIMSGLIHFKLFEQAANFMMSCIKVDVPLSTHNLRFLFDDCIWALDWRGAVSLIRGLASLDTKWPNALLARDSEGACYLINRIYVLLDLCGLRMQYQSVSESTLSNLEISSVGFNRFLSALERAFTRSQQDMANSLGRLPYEKPIFNVPESRDLQLESFLREQEVVGRSIRSIESKLLYPDFSLKFRTSMAMHIGHSRTQDSIKLNNDFVEAASFWSNEYGLKNALLECEHFRVSLEKCSETHFEVVQETLVKQHEVPKEELSNQVQEPMGQWQAWEPAPAVVVKRADRKTEQLRDPPKRLSTPLIDITTAGSMDRVWTKYEGMMRFLRANS